MSESGDERQDEAPKGAGGVDDGKTQLRAELKATLAELAGLQGEIERLASCKHPRESAVGKVCGGCGAEVW